MTVVSRYGYGFVTSVAGLALLASVLSVLLVHVEALKVGIILISGLVLLFVVYFFRDPERVVPSGDQLILSPADGKVVLVKNVRDEEYLRSEALQVSIFLSPLDVHVNRIPVSGKIRYMNYVKGEYLVAFDEKASEKNERTVIGIENGKFKILMRQIAGFVARRIVCDLQMGDDVRAGDRFGMIKFGSRVDILLPPQAELKIRLNDRVVAGETVLAVVLS